VAVSIETLLDIKHISEEEMTGMLRTVEQRCKPTVVHDSQGRLLLCEEWMAKLKLRESEGKGGGSSSGNASGKKCGARGKDRGCGNGDGVASSSRNGNKHEFRSGSGPTKKDQCKCYGKFSHWARYYRSKPKAEAHVAQVKEEIESALLMARATIIDIAPHAGSFKIQTPHRPLHVIEEKVFVQLDEEAPHDESL
jgi:hypothetical protein